MCVRFCPKLFQNDPKYQNNLFDIPYKMIFAIATTDAVLIYSTQSLVPVIIVSNILGILHYASLTDMAWNGSKLLSVSSSDGYCSFFIFNQSELGIELPEYGNKSQFFFNYILHIEMSEEIKTIMIKKEITLEKNKENVIEEDKDKKLIENSLIQKNEILVPTQTPLTQTQVITNIGGKKRIQPALIVSFKTE